MSTSFFSSFSLKAAAAALAVVATAGTVSTVQAQTDGNFRQAVEADIDQKLNAPGQSRASYSGIAIMAVNLDGAGEVRSVDLVQSAGRPALDREAMRVARTVNYPGSGKGRTVAMVLGFNKQVNNSQRAKGHELVTAWASDNRVMLADKTTVQQPDS